MKQEYKEAFTEVNEIIKMMPNELVERIPNKFRKMIEEERLIEYHPNIQEPLEKQKLKNETIIILGLIYRDFLCSPEERIKLQEKDSQEWREVQKIIEENKIEFNPDDIFKKKKQNDIEDQIKENNSIVVIEQEKWYTKIFNIIKKLFKKND